MNSVSPQFNFLFSPYEYPCFEIYKPSTTYKSWGCPCGNEDLSKSMRCQRFIEQREFRHRRKHIDSLNHKENKEKELKGRKGKKTNDICSRKNTYVISKPLDSITFPRKRYTISGSYILIS